MGTPAERREGALPAPGSLVRPYGPALAPLRAYNLGEGLSAFVRSPGAMLERAVPDEQPRPRAYLPDLGSQPALIWSYARPTDVLVPDERRGRSWLPTPGGDALQRPRAPRDAQPDEAPRARAWLPTAGGDALWAARGPTDTLVPDEPRRPAFFIPVDAGVTMLWRNYAAPFPEEAFPAEYPRARTYLPDQGSPPIPPVTSLDFRGRKRHVIFRRRT